MGSKVRKMIITSLLIALAIIIPVQFGFLKIVIPPFTATLGAHLPIFMAMLISPAVAAIVGVGSVVGFIFAGLPLYVAARAASHIVVGYIGGKVYKKSKSLKRALLITAPIHGIIEGVCIIPFGFSMYEMIVVVIIGTILHHSMDSIITVALKEAIVKVKGEEIFTLYN